MDKSVAIGYALFLYAICEILLNKYFNIAYQGEPVVVSRPRNENVVIISENEYRRMSSSNHLLAYYYKLTKSGSFDAQKDAEISDMLDNEMSYINSPYKSMSEKEFLEKKICHYKRYIKAKFRMRFWQNVLNKY